ncbi:hypothetical protein RR46_00759 [Papilio xuthus]|uniref:U5 small nuclear ribonucleoprotein TSSC4 n=1 Tax=Papilio xuthus TaxID=66420 RepID=A0A0N1IN62_PAPXU|nr:hypothetical protein RR46_00756 [Papilio xuthus]KPJ03775.1 hypothetical protein RR46_00759 [Papilio xuthus]
MSSYFERQKSLFNTLKDAEEQYSFSKTNKASPDTDYGVIDRSAYRKLKNEMKKFVGKESIFKRPEAKLRNCLRPKTVPDHVKNPDKWVYYSLSDVTAEQMSDATNTATALALIRELEERNIEKHSMDEDSHDSFVFKKPLFKASKTLKVKPIEDDEKPTIKQTKIIMPEYVVGVSKKKEKKNKVQISNDNSNRTKKVELKLNHLTDLDDESED